MSGYLLRFVVYFVFAANVLSVTTPQLSAADQTLEQQLEALADEVKDIVGKDRILQKSRLHLDEISSSGTRDSNYKLPIKLKLTEHLKSILDDASNNSLKVEYSYIESEVGENNGKQIIQLSAKIIVKGKPLTLKTREGTNTEILKVDVNNSSDVAAMTGSLVSFNGGDNGAARLKKISDSFEHPQFKIDGPRLSLLGNSLYAIELRCSPRPDAEHQPMLLGPKHKLPFADIPIGHTYEVVLYNFDTKNDAVVDVTIDGLSAINAFNIDKDSLGNPERYPGYLVNRSENGQPGIHVIPGWMHTVSQNAVNKDNVFQFVVNELGKGAASQLKSTGEVGVITTRWFDATRNDLPVGRAIGGETGIGRPMPVDYQVAEVTLGSRPVVVLSIRYSHND